MPLLLHQHKKRALPAGVALLFSFSTFPISFKARFRRDISAWLDLKRVLKKADKRTGKKGEKG